MDISPPREREGVSRGMILAWLLGILVIAAGIYLFVLPGRGGADTSVGLDGRVKPAVPVNPIVTTPLPSVSSLPALTHTPDPFPDALRLKQLFPFGSGAVASEATVYRYWTNDTYEWHNDKDNRYYVELPGTGNKFLFVFVHLQNIGNTRVWFPPAENILVYHNGVTYTEDQDHFKPDEAVDEEASPVEVKEVQYFPKLNGDEYVEDFGFSHGTELSSLYPGASNAVDGYIVYEVPKSLIPEETYVTISFNAQDRGVWKLV
jgi:hypothetical protein